MKRRRIKNISSRDNFERTFLTITTLDSYGYSLFLFFSIFSLVRFLSRSRSLVMMYKKRMKRENKRSGIAISTKTAFLPFDIVGDLMYQ